MNAVSPDDVVLKFPSQNRSIPPKAVKLLGYKKVTLEGDLKSLTQENRQEIQSLVLQTQVATLRSRPALDLSPLLTTC